LSTDEGGQAFNNAVQACVAAGVDVLTLHHPRKAPAEGRTGLTSLHDVYGSTWLTAGQGSVIALDSRPGDGRVKLRHLKTPAEEVGPLEIDIDYTLGTVSTMGRRDVLEYLTTCGDQGATTTEVVIYVHGSADDRYRKQVGRQLKELEEAGAVDSDKDGKALRWWRI
jgi:hypothetical protein